jgi:cation transport ATPase
MRTFAAIIAISLGVAGAAYGETIAVTLNAVLCDSCVHEIEKTFARQPEVEAVHVDLAQKQVKIELKRGETMSDLKVIELLKRSGYVAGRIARVR